MASSSKFHVATLKEDRAKPSANHATSPACTNMQGINILVINVQIWASVRADSRIQVPDALAELIRGLALRLAYLLT